MSNVDELGFSGLETKSNNQLVSELKTNFQNIYSVNGEVLNFNSNTPDGQFIEILAELGTIIREMITEVYNSCDPDKCVGAIQDNRYAINNLTRNAGSYTLQNVSVTATKTVSLQGLDGSFNEEEASAYTISDNAGNIWYLVDSQTIYAGTTNLEFRAKEKGAIIPTIGTITNQVTIIDGITSVINNVGVTIVGTEEESDADFRIRRNRSVSNNGQNSIDAIIGNILALDGVVAVNAHVNYTNSTDDTGTLPHYIWVIVEGGANTEIAEVIYANIGGAGTRGDMTVPIITAGLQTFNVHFDRADIVPLYIKFDLKNIVALGEIDQDAIIAYIVNNLTYNIGENAETSKVTDICADALLANGGGGYALNVQISKDNVTWSDYLEVTSLADKFTTDANKIFITPIVGE